MGIFQLPYYTDESTPTIPSQISLHSLEALKIKKPPPPPPTLKVLIKTVLCQ